MIDPTILPIYLLACIIALAVPGPDVVFIVATGVAQGRPAAIGGACGIAVGLIAHTVLATIGLSTIVATSPISFAILQYGGAAYLLWCAWRILHSPLPDMARPDEAVPAGAWQGFRRGVLTNLLNPKAILFAGLFLPQFVRLDHGPVFLQILCLGAIMAALALAWFSILAVASGSVGRWLLGDRRRGCWLQRALALVFTGLAVRLLLTRREG